MLINRLQHNMDRVIEGIDTLDVSLILEASKEFEAGVDGLKKSIQQFDGILKKYQQLGGLQQWTKECLERLDSIDLEKIPKEYSFKDHKKLLNADEDSDQPDGVISDISMKFPAAVNALKDAILAVAQWFEEYPNLFSVGKDGILFQQEFQNTIADPKALKINDFAGPGEEILKKISGKEGDEMRAHFEPLWKKEDVEKEKEDEAYEAFVTGFEKIGQGAQVAHDEASKVVKDSEPPDNIKKGVSSLGGMLKGIISAIFGGGGDETPDISTQIELIVGTSKEDDQTGIFGMTFVELQSLISDVIASVESANTAGGKALQGIDAQQKETMAPDDKDAAFIKELQGIVKDQEITVDVGVAAEEAGMKDGDKSTIDKEKFIQALEQTTDLDEEQLKHLLGEMELEGEDEGSEPEGESPEEVVRNAIPDEEEQEAFVDLMKSEEFVDDEGAPNPEKSEEEIDDLIDAGVDEIEEDKEEEIKKALTVQEESVFRRWGQLAGIIKG